MRPAWPFVWTFTTAVGEAQAELFNGVSAQPSRLTARSGKEAETQ